MLNDDFVNILTQQRRGPRGTKVPLKGGVQGNHGFPC
jgi:hypothetical protein